MIRVLLVDDHAILRAGVRVLLSAYPDLQVVGEASNGAEALVRTNELKPDVIVMDIAMPDVNGLVATRQILEAYPTTKIVILTQYDNKEYVLALIKLGVSGYVLKQAVDTDLVLAIRTVMQGESFLYPPIAKTVLEAYLQKPSMEEVALDLLTDREREVLVLIAQGKSSREIGGVLHISPNTVDVHRTRLMKKLDLHNVAELVTFAIKRGLVE